MKAARNAMAIMDQLRFKARTVRRENSMKKNDAPDPGWAPEFTLDLTNASGQAFQKLVDAFDQSTRNLGEDIPPLPFNGNGWYTVTPQDAEISLRRNRPGANRKAAFSTVVYYATQMLNNAWPRTGQPIIFTIEDILNDGQHRLWASYLARVSFDTFVVTDAPNIENAFAYIDNVKVRNASAALQTAGLNGLSPLISQLILIAHHYEIGAYTCDKKTVVRMAPIEVLHYAQKYPAVRDAARLVAGEHKAVYQLIGHKDVTAFVAFQIIRLHDEELCDRFLEEVAYSDQARPEHDPIRALHVYLAKQAKSDKPAAKHLILAHVIKAFNAWFNSTPMKRLYVATDDLFPQFVEAEQAQEEAPE